MNVTVHKLYLNFNVKKRMKKNESTQSIDGEVSEAEASWLLNYMGPAGWTSKFYDFEMGVQLSGKVAAKHQ
jgi:hypothetical protein